LQGPGKASYGTTVLCKNTSGIITTRGSAYKRWLEALINSD
jgi:hypothetical protein